MHAKLADASTTAAAQFEALPRFPLVVMGPGTMFTTLGERGVNRLNPSNHYVTLTWEKIAARAPPRTTSSRRCWRSAAPI